jgi:hypothetical protein
MRSAPYRVVRGYLRGTALVALPLAIALSPASGFATTVGGPVELTAFNSDPALTRDELDQLRGGFFLPNGNMINFGISVQQYVNNQLANSVSLKVNNNFTLTQTSPSGTTSFFTTPQGGMNSVSFTPSKFGTTTGTFNPGSPTSNPISPPSTPTNSPSVPNTLTNTQTPIQNSNNTPHLGTTFTPGVGTTNLVTTNTQTPSTTMNTSPTSITFTPSGLNATLTAVANGGLTNLGITVNNGAIQSVIQNSANNQVLQSVMTLNLTTQGLASTLHNVVMMNNIAGIIQSNALMHH